MQSAASTLVQFRKTFTVVRRAFVSSKISLRAYVAHYTDRLIHFQKHQLRILNEKRNEAPGPHFSAQSPPDTYISLFSLTQNLPDENFPIKLLRTRTKDLL